MTFKDKLQSGKFLFISIIFILLLMAAKVILASSKIEGEDIILAELKNLKIEIAGPLKQQEIQLPEQLTDANWGLKNIICKEGGYDLESCAGKEALFTVCLINEKFADTEPLKAWVITCENKIACVYKTVTEDSNAAPGIFPAKQTVNK